MTPTDCALLQVAQQAHRLAPVLRDLVGDVAEAGVAHGAISASARLRAGSTIAQPAAVTPLRRRAPGSSVSNRAARRGRGRGAHRRRLRASASSETVNSIHRFYRLARLGPVNAMGTNALHGRKRPAQGAKAKAGRAPGETLQRSDGRFRQQPEGNGWPGRHSALFSSRRRPVFASSAALIGGPCHRSRLRP